MFSGAAASSPYKIMTPPELRGTIPSAYIMIFSLIGVGGGPAVAARLTALLFAGDAMIGWGIAATFALFMPFSALCLMTAARSMPPRVRCRAGPRRQSRIASRCSTQSSRNVSARPIEMAEATEIANNTCFGLAAYVWSADIERAARVRRQINAGFVQLNDSQTLLDEPFGGAIANRVMAVNAARAVSPSISRPRRWSGRSQHKRSCQHAHEC